MTVHRLFSCPAAGVPIAEKQPFAGRSSSTVPAIYKLDNFLLILLHFVLPVIVEPQMHDHICTSLTFRVSEFSQKL